MVYDGTGTRTSPAAARIRNPSADATQAPRRRSSASPLARITVIASTQSRVLPYLNVAAPAAFVATLPPANAPANVGRGGYVAPATLRAASSSAASLTPAS